VKVAFVDEAGREVPNDDVVVVDTLAEVG
jgi:hypothetical protein